MLSTRYKIAKFATYLVAAAILCVLQNTPGLFVVGGVKPMLVMSFAVCVTLFEKETAGGLFGAFCGLLCDLFSPYTFGFYALMLFCFCVLVGLVTQGFMRPVLVNALIFTFVTVTAIQYSGFFFTILIWDEPDAMSFFVTTMLPMCVYTAVTAALLFYPTRRVHLYFEGLIAAA